MTPAVEVQMELSSSFRSVQADMTEEFEIHGPVKDFNLISSCIIAIPDNGMKNGIVESASKPECFPPQLTFGRV